MIYLLALALAVVMCVLPLWTLPLVCLLFGFLMRLNWRDCAKMGSMAALIVIAVSAGLDFKDQHLITKRMGGMLHLEARLAMFLVPLLPGLLTLWISVLFTRLGASLRTIYKK